MIPLILTIVMKFSSEEIKEATKSFDVEHLIGEGGFEKVYHARLRHTAAAIKILNNVYQISCTIPCW